MDFDEFVSFLDETVTEKSLRSLDLDFDINNVFEEPYALPDEEPDEEIVKAGRRKLKNITEIQSSIGHMTTLHMAVVKDQPRVVQWLMNNGADPSVKCEFNEYEYKTTQEKGTKNGRTFWVNADFTSSRHLTSHTHAMDTALELAERLDNQNCVEILRSFAPAPS